MTEAEVMKLASKSCKGKDKKCKFHVHPTEADGRIHITHISAINNAQSNIYIHELDKIKEHIKNGSEAFHLLDNVSAEEIRDLGTKTEQCASLSAATAARIRGELSDAQFQVIRGWHKVHAIPD